MYEVEEPVNISQLEASEDTVDFHREDTPICTGESADRNDAAAGEAPQIAGGNVSTELASAILKQVEFYFGDTNLPTDEFLLQHVKKSPQGWVNLNLIARFKRMKALTTSVPTIAEALQNSEFLVVSSDGKAVRRKNPLPKIDEAEASSRTVVAENLPAEAHGIDALTELFSKCGTVRMVRVCQPGEVKSVLQREASGRGSHGGGKQSLTVSNQVHALVEFSSAEEAAAACRELTDDSSWWGARAQRCPRGTVLFSAVYGGGWIRNILLPTPPISRAVSLPRVFFFLFNPLPDPSACCGALSFARQPLPPPPPFFPNPNDRGPPEGGGRVAEEEGRSLTQRARLVRGRRSL
mmetsp:Transcript_11438/g.27153  ORF Transcript_11438/g.27153 Transcript_11438/m.27153 type:complete len:351 (-) Transcript_11438:23-1075(-)